jgi:hypothetical protein
MTPDAYAIATEMSAYAAVIRRIHHTRSVAVNSIRAIVINWLVIVISRS